MESLRFDVEPFGIRTTIVEPGFFRTELLVEGSSTIWPELSIDDYADRTDVDDRGVAEHERPAGRRPRQARRRPRHASPRCEDPPLRFVAGADAVAAVEQKAHDLLAQIDAHRDLSTNLAHDAPSMITCLDHLLTFDRRQSKIDACSPSQGAITALRLGLAGLFALLVLLQVMSLPGRVRPHGCRVARHGVPAVAAHGRVGVLGPVRTGRDRLHMAGCSAWSTTIRSSAPGHWVGSM